MQGASAMTSENGRATTQPPALTSEGVRGRLLPELLAVARFNVALHYLTDDL
jgi:hypothetical protein